VACSETSDRVNSLEAIVGDIRWYEPTEASEWESRGVSTILGVDLLSDNFAETFAKKGFTGHDRENSI